MGEKYGKSWGIGRRYLEELYALCQLPPWNTLFTGAFIAPKT
ncbi:MAG: hypothetical protein QW808_00620 [Desulfurococcaceae archaeon]